MVSDDRYEMVAATREVQQLKVMVKTNKIASIEEMNDTISTMGQS